MKTCRLCREPVFGSELDPCEVTVDSAVVDLDGKECEIVGEPDFLIRTAAGHVIRDSKLARTIDDRRHPEIRLQLQLYGFLYERLVGRPPAALEVHAGSGELVFVPYDGGGAALGYLRFLRSLRADATEPYEPVGWSKCGGCGSESAAGPAPKSRMTWLCSRP
jgi:hypothetical protein